MGTPQVVMYEEEQQQIQAICDRLQRDSNAIAVLVIDKNGQEIARAGEIEHLDVTSLSSLTAGNVAATGGIAKLLAEKEFAGQFHEGEKTNIHISIVAQRVILVVLFDERSSLGLVRLRVRKATDELAKVLDVLVKKMASGNAAAGARRDHRRRHRQPVQRLRGPEDADTTMSFINYCSREINCKIVYYGPGLCGKTTNLQYIYNKTNPEAKGKMISLATETERTLFFDFLPLSLGEIRGFKTRFHLYTVPGQVFYDASRKLILKGVDGVVFVADSQIERMEANIESLDNLRVNLQEQGYNLDKLPYRRAVQQARSAERDPDGRAEEGPQPDQGARVRGGGDDGRRSVRHAEGSRQAGADRAQARRVMSTPRIRSDLQATPAEEGGIKYFDVSDPKSGSHMRLYDFEWLIAERMDGRRPFDEVASWARERLGIAPSASDLEVYARKLKDLGFFDITDGDESAPARSAPNAPTMMREAPTLPSSGNGARHAADDEVPDLVAESPLMGSAATAVPVPAEEPRVTRNHAPAATAPTMAMPVTAERPAVMPEHPAPLKTPAAPAPAAAPRATAERHDEAPARSSVGSIIGIVLVMAVVGGIVAYVKLMGGSSAAKVTTIVATPREVVRLYDGAAAVKKSEGQTLSFGEAGKVSDVVAAGTEAKAGMPLATLESYAKVEKDLADVKDRDGYYEKQLATAKAKGEEAAIKAAEAKVAEKKKLLAELEARAGKVRLVAPGPITVAKVMVTAGADVKAGAPVVQLADKRSVAEFKLAPADAAAMKPGAAVTLQPAAGGAPIAGRVARVDGGTVTVELVDDAAAKPGDSLRLVKARVPNVVPVPAAAVIRHEGSDVVFVLSEGTVHERRVTVVDKTPSEVLVGSGLTSGDQVVSSGGDSLKDGEKATQ